MHKERGAWGAAETHLPSYFYPHRWFALLPSIAEHWAINLTSFPRTICPWVTLSYFQTPPLTILLPKAFWYLFRCPILFPYCLSHLFILVAFCFLAVGLHTATLPSLPFLPSSLHPYAFAPCPASTCWRSPLSCFAFTRLELCCSTCSRAAPLHFAHSHSPNPRSSESFATDRSEPRIWLCNSKLSWVCAHFSGTHGDLRCRPSLQQCCVCPESIMFQSLPQFQNNPFKKRERKAALNIIWSTLGVLQGKQQNK